MADLHNAAERLFEAALPERALNDQSISRMAAAGSAAIRRANRRLNDGRCGHRAALEKMRNAWEAE